MHSYAPDPSLLPGSNLAEEFAPFLFNETFSDVTIVVGEQRFPAHLVLIQARSKPLYNYLCAQYVLAGHV